MLGEDFVKPRILHEGKYPGYLFIHLRTAPGIRPTNTTAIIVTIVCPMVKAGVYVGVVGITGVEVIIGKKTPMWAGTGLDAVLIGVGTSIGDDIC